MSIYYQDEWVTLIHGDWRTQGLKVLRGEPRADAIITDPPYGETNLEWDRWPKGWPEQASRLADAMWCFGSMRMFLDRRAEFNDWQFSQEIVWEKHNGSSLANDRFRRVHELATLWYQGDWANIRHQTPTTPDATPRTVRRKAKPAQHQGERGPSHYVSQDGGPRLMRSVQYVRSTHGHAIHPTQKPEGIVAPLIEYSVPRGGLVLDLFAGSATTAAVARQMGRRCIAFEAREDYARAAAQRLAQQAFVFEEV
ncbi:site-specific DNA-methyltransferase [Streptomyces sp. AC495_CC817]|uniref:DNA-methyltransferase n=1 Tax=Streptomyces sp. AC495_CC817 TaxID=2823900 RepID=UPI001C26591B|nr:site-specific DNA-methyltransferase [Streptomyces sp. AC495_CC817]